MRRFMLFVGISAPRVCPGKRNGFSSVDKSGKSGFMKFFFFFSFLTIDVLYEC